MAKKIGIIGKGNVASALKGGLDREGYETRTGGKGSAPEIAAWGDILILAVPYTAAASVLAEAGSSLDGKILIDTTNPLNQELQLSIGFTTSAAEEIQRLAPKAKVVKCFNTVFASGMTTGQVKGQQISAFLAGDDVQAKRAVAELARDIGFDVVDAGKLEHARWVEALAFLNIQLGFTQNLGTYIGFKLVH